MRPLTINGHRIKVNGKNVDRIHTYGGRSFAVDRCTSRWLFNLNRCSGFQEQYEPFGAFNPYKGYYHELPLIYKMEGHPITTISNPRERKMWKGYFFGLYEEGHSPEGVPRTLTRVKEDHE